MKNKFLLIAALAAGAMMCACDDDEPVAGNPVIEPQTEIKTAQFGDSLAFVVKASDQEVPLSTLKAQLYFGEEKVSETVIRTKVSGENYQGKVYVPYLKDVPSGTAKLKFILQNINFTITEDSIDVAIVRPDFPYLTLVTTGGKEYKMTKKSGNVYAVTATFPKTFKGVIHAPKVGANGNELAWAYSQDGVTLTNPTDSIPFEYVRDGDYEVTFDTQTFQYSPFLKMTVSVDGGEEKELKAAGANDMLVDLELKNGSIVKFTDVPDYDNWWIDPDFFEKQSDGTLKVVAPASVYRINANLKLKYFEVNQMTGSSYTSLSSRGNGALWLIGAAVGKPNARDNAVAWTTEKALCMPKIDGAFQITLVAGVNIPTNELNFKFYGGAKSWNNEFKHDRISTTSDLIYIGDGDTSKENNDDGNVYLKPGVTLENGAAYRFTVKMSVEGSGLKAVVDVKKL